MKANIPRNANKKIQNVSNAGVLLFKNSQIKKKDK